MDEADSMRSIGRVFAILKCIATQGSLSLSDVSRSVGLPYPTTTRIVKALMHEGLIECESRTKQYRTTRIVETLADGYRNRDGNLVDASLQPIADLTARVRWPVTVTTANVANLGEPPSMVVRDSTHAQTSLAFSRCHPGETFPMLDSAAGLVHLTYVDDEARERLLATMEERRQNPVAIKMFRSGQLTRRIKADGFASCDREVHTREPGLTSSISVPIMSGSREAGQLSLTFFASAMSMTAATSRFVEELHQTAHDIAEALPMIGLQATPHIRPAPNRKPAVEHALSHRIGWRQDACAMTAG